MMTPIDPAFLLIPILQTIKPVSNELELRTLQNYAYASPQNDGSAGLFQPLDDILDEAMPKIIRAVDGRTSDDTFPSVSQEDVLFLTRCDCVINALKRICDFQSASAAVLSLGDCPQMIDTQVSPRNSRFTATLKTR
jgi:ribonuclease H2 subunit B